MDIIDELRSYRVETDLASWYPEICDRAADCITDLMARCDRLEEARENANEACAKWEALCHMAEQERDTYKAALQNWHDWGACGHPDNGFDAPPMGPGDFCSKGEPKNELE